MLPLLSVESVPTGPEPARCTLRLIRDATPPSDPRHRGPHRRRVRERGGRRPSPQGGQAAGTHQDHRGEHPLEVRLDRRRRPLPPPARRRSGGHPSPPRRNASRQDPRVRRGRERSDGGWHRAHPSRRERSPDPFRAGGIRRVRRRHCDVGPDRAPARDDALARFQGRPQHAGDLARDAPSYGGAVRRLRPAERRSHPRVGPFHGTGPPTHGAHRSGSRLL